MFKPKPLSSEYLGTSGMGWWVDLHKTNRIGTQVSEADTIRGGSVIFSKSMPLVSKESFDSSQKSQSQKLLDEEATTTGINVNLMNKDNSGAIFDNPPRKPPINNFEPLVHENKAP